MANSGTRSGAILKNIAALAQGRSQLSALVDVLIPCECLDVWKCGSSYVFPSVWIFLCANIRMSGYISFLMDVCLSI